MKKVLFTLGIILTLGGLVVCKIFYRQNETIEIDKSPVLNIDETLKSAESQLSSLLDLAQVGNKNPRTTNTDGETYWIGDTYDWTEGFWPGTCWMLYEYSNLEKWKKGAISGQELYTQHKDLTNDHDLGFIFNCSYGKAYRILGEQKYYQVMLDATNSLVTRFNPKVGCIQSWDCVDNWQSKRGWKFPVIIDNMMNLELLFEVANITGDDAYRKIAITHANTTMKNHFRPDGSSYHVIDYDPETGAVRNKVTAQGYADESAWARGQAWGLYGFTMCYRFTHNDQYLKFAEKIAGFILSHPNYPEDGIPYWDFNAPEIPDEKRDASSAAILASAFIELSSYTNGKYINQAEHILKTLASDQYTAKPGTNGNFVLMHSVGSLPHGNEIDVPLNYADYYYIEALVRLKTWKQK